MVEACISLNHFSVDEFTCPVCLNLLDYPLAIPCGHTFCKVCINGCWDQEDVMGVYKCPQCRETFTPRPVLRRNNMLAEVVEKLKKTVQVQAEIKSQQRIQEKEKKIQELKGSVDTIKRRSQSAVDDSERIFTELISSLEKKRSEVKDLIRAQEEAELSRAEQLLKQLEQEITDLKKRLSELEQLSHSHDHIHFLQRFPSLCVSPGCEASPSFTVNQHLSFDGVKKSLSDLKKRVEEICKEEFNRIRPQAAAVKMILPSEPKSREDFMQYACYLTLDPNTAYCYLRLSENNRAVTCSRTIQQYSDHPERFDSWAQVLCKESVCGRCYWEVEWSSHVDISVSYKEMRRKGLGNDCLFGCNSQSWSLECSFSSVSFWHNRIKTSLRGPSSSRIGVFVDHSAGTLSFYSVSDTMRLLHRVHTTFTQPLYAGFWMCGSGSAVKLCDPKLKDF